MKKNSRTVGSEDLLATISEGTENVCHDGKQLHQQYGGVELLATYSGKCYLMN